MREQSPKLYLIPSAVGAEARGEEAASLFKSGLSACGRSGWVMARLIFSKSLQLGSADIATLNNLAVCHAALGEELEAAALFLWAGELNLYSGPAGGTALANRAMLSAHAGRVEEAVEFAEAALSLNPGTASRQAARAAYTASGKPNLAEKYREETVNA